MSKAKRTAAVYARFSSDLQKDKSIDDQFAECERIADREGFEIVERFSDRAKSGASMFERDGLLDLMKRARERRFDVVVVYDLSRLSRDQEDLAGIFKRLTFFEIDIWTLDGKATPIHIGIRGITNSLFRDDLARNVRRGHNGLIRTGKIPGAVPYGYRVTLKKGEPEIDPSQAAIVQRIYREYVGGASPRTIAIGLTRDGIASPSGNIAWNFRGLISSGGADERFGILCNPLYTGKLIWNRRRTKINPDSGKKSYRASPENEVASDLPHLRIIEQPLWDAAQAMLKKRANGSYGQRAFITRNEHLLSGLLRCGACNGPMRVRGRADGKTYVACVAADRHSACAHRRNYNLDVLSEHVIAGVRELLKDPELMHRTIAAYHDQYAIRMKQTRGDLATVKAELNRVQVKLDRLVIAIEESDESVKDIMARFKPLEVQRASLTERLRLLEAENKVIDLHPKAIQNYHSSIDIMAAALAHNTRAPEVRAAFGNLIDCIVVHPTDRKDGIEFTPYARLAAITGGVDLFPTLRSAEKILSDHGAAACCAVPHENTGVTAQQDRIVSLGRWRAAA